MSCFHSSLALHESCFYLITKHFASQFGFRTFVSFLFRGFGRPPCRVPYRLNFSSSFSFSFPPSASSDFSIISQPISMKFCMLTVFDDTERLHIYFRVNRTRSWNKAWSQSFTMLYNRKNSMYCA